MCKNDWNHDLLFQKYCWAPAIRQVLCCTLKTKSQINLFSALAEHDSLEVYKTLLGGKPVLAQCAVTAQRGYRRWRREEGFWCAVRKEWGREMASWGEVSSCRFSRTGTMKLISGDWGRDSQTAQTPSSYPSLFMYSCLFLAMPRSIWLS